MQSILAGMQEEACKYADAISGVTGTDVEIVDEFMLRVAGTGMFRNMLNQDMSATGYVYRHTLQSNHTILIDDCGHSEVCRACSRHGNCTEMLDLATPIVFQGHAIGVIGIICSTSEQRDALLGQIDKFVTFIEQIADLIAGKAFALQEKQREQRIADTLRNLIEVIDHGVIAFDTAGTVVHANLSATRMFGSKRGIVGQHITMEMSGDVIYDRDEVRMTLADGSRLHALCKRITLSQRAGDITVVVFQDARDYLPQTLPSTDAPGPVALIGRSPQMHALRERIERVAASTVSVLITGESGTGKEVVASAIHYQSARHDAPFVTINCAAIPEQLLESELFGYVKGAFSGADPKGRIGKFELAHGGSIFLDEIGDMPVHLQAKLLRVLQERVITRIGSNQVIEVDVRIIAATNKNIAALVERGLFREDLFYRLNVVPLMLPPLRERRMDVAELAQFFVDELTARHGVPALRLGPRLINALYLHDWPGNVRELRNAIEYMLVMQGDARELNPSHLPPTIGARDGASSDALASPSIHAGHEEAERIRQTLERHGWSVAGKKQAAEELGIGIATLYRRMKKYGVATSNAGE